jgi:signal transduction histidine kinase/DNA-binding response OmpR family regulator
MKRFYVIFFALCILSSALLYMVSIWWFLAGAAACMIIIAYHFYAARFRSIEARNEGLQHQVEQLHLQLDQSILKEERSGREADQVKQAKQKLLAVMSHEIRTPMNGVIGMSLLLSESALTREQSEYTETIRSCAETLLTTVNDILVHDLLNFSKMDQEGKQLENIDFDLRNCLEEVLDMFSTPCGAAGIELIYCIDGDVPEQVIGDSKRLRQVLMNLVENAVKFTPKGEIFVSIHSLSSRIGGPTQLLFEVRDSGIGIDDDHLKQLFNGIPGKESAREGGAEASGLGLVICRTLVELMGGQIEVKSQPGQGSTFSFVISLTPSLKVKRNQAHLDLMASLEGKHILLVEDNATHLAILLKQMEAWKSMPAVAVSGKQALENLSGNPDFDLVITDMDMPGMDGIQLTKAIKDQHPAMPVILMHAAGDERYRQYSEIFSSVLIKPLRQYMLRDHLLGVFSHSDKLSPHNQHTMNQLSGDLSERFPLRILVAEDNIINQKIGIKILGKLGYQPDLARNGKEVLEMVSHEHYDLILMDVQMPEMDGLEATRMLRVCLEMQPVIIAMTANAMQGDRDACMQAGMDDYISKPMELKELLSLLEKWGRSIRNKKQVLP